MKFSLIVPTVYKFDKVLDLLDSIRHSERSQIDIEIVIVDQNLNNDLRNVVRDNFQDLNIIYFKSKVKGLSIARNKGLSLSTGDIIIFSDDDVIYNMDYFSNLKSNVISNPQVDVFVSKLLNIEDDEYYTFAPTPMYKSNGLLNYMACCSVTLNVRKESIIKFNERLGAGAYFGACEDSDFVLRLFRAQKSFKYFDDMIVRHPRLVKANNNYERVKSYALGFGAFYKIQNLKGGKFKIYFMKAFVILLLRSFMGCFLRPLKFKYYMNSFSYKIKGYRQY